MTGYLLPGVIGLLLGMVLHWAGFSRPATLRDALGLRRSCGLRSGAYALGFSMALTALLCWLAVIDVDDIAVMPLSAGALAGGAVFGIAAGLSGFMPVTAFAGIGGGPVLEALSIAAGCLLAALALPALSEPLTALHAAPPFSATTLFEVTLDEPFLLGGGFLGQGCAGLLLMAIAACIPMPRIRRADALDENKPSAEETADTPAGSQAEDESTPTGEGTPDDTPAAEDDPPPEPGDALPPGEPPLLLPAAAPEETFVALLPGEEPLVVDTQLDEPPDTDNPPMTETDAPALEDDPPDGTKNAPDP